MSSDDFSSLHDVYGGLSGDEKCQTTTYVIQDLSSDFDVVGPYFSCSSTMETQFLQVTRTMLAFSQFEFQVRALLYDEASINLSLWCCVDAPTVKVSI